MLYYNNVPFALDRYEISENQSLANAGSLLKYNYSIVWHILVILQCAWIQEKACFMGQMNQ